MKATEYILNTTNKLVAAFPTIKVLYKYDHDSMTHLIHVSPPIDPLINQEFRCLKEDVINHFILSYPAEAVLFIDEDDIDLVENPDVEKEGVLFAYKYIQDILTPSGLIYYDITFPKSVDTVLTANLLSLFTPKNKINLTSQPSKEVGNWFKSLFQKKNLDDTKSTPYSQINDEGLISKTSEKLAGENTYAMAA
jgi:hypothetical protein